MSRRGAVLGLAGLGLAAALVAGASEPVRAATWYETAGLQFWVADSVDVESRIFDSPDYQHTLIVPGGSERAFVLGLKEQTLYVLPREAIEWSEKEAPTPDIEQAQEVGLFFNDQGHIHFDFGDYAYKLLPEPPLVGQITLQKLRESKPDYVVASDKYSPDEQAMAALQELATDTQVKVFFGTWCSYCKHWLPPFMEIASRLDSEHLKVDYYGMSEDQSQPAAELSKFDIGKTPTFVFLQNGEEVGRIEEEPIVSMEADMARILGLQ